MSVLRCLFLTLALCSGTGSVLAEAPRYMVEMELQIDGEQRLAPMLIVEADKPAELISTGPDGQSGWKIGVEVESPAQIENTLSPVIWLHVTIAELVNGEWDYLTDALLGVPEGQSSSLSLHEGEGDDPADSQVHLTALVSRLMPGEG